ncbi:MAG: putative sulfate exporter family transporter [Rikenellaceae bacterium]
MKRAIFFILVVVSLLLSPALSLLMGIAFAVAAGDLFERQKHKASSMLLKIAVVGIGFGMNIEESLRTSYEGIIFTIFSVLTVMISGVFLARKIGVGRSEGYLIASGTAICGGSAIAAIAPVVRAKPNEISISLAVVFTLNAIAMLIFPLIGAVLELTQQQFGVWSAIAIHDTSAVVGAAKAYGEEALQIATTVKLSRALWIIPLSLVSLFIFKDRGAEAGKISIPWFILLFIVAMVINTYMPLGETLSNVIKVGSHKLLNTALFLIGTTLSLSSIKQMGAKPILLGISLWILISVISLLVVTLW